MDFCDWSHSAALVAGVGWQTSTLGPLENRERGDGLLGIFCHPLRLTPLQRRITAKCVAESGEARVLLIGEH